MRKLDTVKAAIAGFAIGLFVVGSGGIAVAASASISHSFKSSGGSITTGSLVSLDSSRSGYVQAANPTNSRRLIGVVVPANGSLLAVNPDIANAVQVATSGTTSTLVSDLNGAIAVGDQISASPFSGVGMKAAPGSRFIGLARTAFSSKSPGVTTQSITDKSGHATKVALGYINVSIGIGTLPGTGAGDNLNALQGVAKSFTGHIVSTARIIFSLVIILITVMALVPLIYGAIYSGIVSIGRNPLARYEILRSLVSVFIISILLIAAAGVTVYLLLR